MRIILFTGLSASGKTIIARQTADKLDLPLVEYHLLMHNEAESRGFTRIRDWMKQIGGFENALREVHIPLVEKIEESRGSKGIVIDQIVDLNTLGFLKEHLPADELYIIFVRSNRHDRKHWAIKRDPQHGWEDMLLKDRLKFKAGINKIIENADLRIDNISSIEHTTNLLTEYLINTLFNEGSDRGLERDS